MSLEWEDRREREGFLASLECRVSSSSQVAAGGNNNGGERRYKPFRGSFLTTQLMKLIEGKVKKKKKSGVAQYLFEFLDVSCHLEAKRSNGKWSLLS